MSGRQTTKKIKRAHLKRKVMVTNQNWIKSFDAKNLLGMKTPAICPEEQFPFHEAKFIKEHKSDKLTNSDETGHGNQNRKREIIDSAAKKLSKPVYQFDLKWEFYYRI
jgi:hypothetical protein